MLKTGIKYDTRYTPSLDNFKSFLTNVLCSMVRMKARKEIQFHAKTTHFFETNHRHLTPPPYFCFNTDQPHISKEMKAYPLLVFFSILPFVFSKLQSPLMGWSTWESFAKDLTDDLVIKNAQILKSSGLQAKGYTVIQVDDGWQHLNRASG